MDDNNMADDTNDPFIAADVDMQQQQEPLDDSQDLEWARSISGRDWEVYWEAETDDDDDEEDAVEDNVTTLESPPDQEGIVKNDTKGMENVGGDGKEVTPDEKEMEDDQDSAKHHEEDWYEATIISYVQQEDGLIIYSVSFVGESDKIYEMQLNPQLVRPSMSAWTKRTRAILSGRPFETKQAAAATSLFEAVQQWEQSLPFDTSLPQDEPELMKLEHDVCKTLFDDLDPSDPNRDPLFKLMLLARTQIYLSSKLVPVDDKYVRFLVECLNDLSSACFWYLECGKLQSTVTKPLLESLPPTERKSTNVFDQLLQEGREALLIIFQSRDTSQSAVTQYRNKKRKHEQALAPTRRPKRNKREQSKRDAAADASDLLEVLDFKSEESIQNVVAQLQQPNMPWFARPLSDALLNFRNNVWVPLDEWQQRVSRVLCDSGDGVAMATGESEQADDTDSEASTGSESRNSPRKHDHRKFVSYDDISLLIDSAENEAVVQHFNVTPTVQRLEQKKHAIDEYGKRVWACIGNMFRGTAVADLAEDDVILEIDTLIDLADSASSAVYNVEPFGPSSTLLSRNLLASARAYRCWYLDLVHAESCKERTAFVEKILNRYTELQQLANTDAMHAMTIQVEGMMPRVQALELRLVNSIKVADTFSAALEQRATAENSDCVNSRSREATEEALQNLRTTSILCRAEEYMCVRLDILDWKERVDSLLNGAKPTFDAVSVLYEQLISLRQGMSPSRSELTQRCRNDADSDSDASKFATQELDTFYSDVESTLRTLYSVSSAWKVKAERLTDELQAFAKGPNDASKASSSMVNVRRISDLLADYHNIPVEFEELNKRLALIYKTCTEWSTSVTDLLMAPSPMYSSMLERLDLIEQCRPLGIIIEPVREVVIWLRQLLSWYTSARDAIAASTGTSIHQLGLVVEGLELLQEFAKCRYQCLSLKISRDTYASYNRLSAIEVHSGQIIAVPSSLAQPLSNHVLQIMFERDEIEGNVLLAYFQLLCFVCAEDCIIRKKSLTEAKELIACPTMTSGTYAFSDLNLKSTVNELRQLIDDGEKREAPAVTELQRAKSLLRDGPFRQEVVTTLCARLDDIRGALKYTPDERGLTLSPAILDDLDKTLVVLRWLENVTRYPIVFGDNEVDNSARISLNDLDNLYEKSLALDDLSGELAPVWRSVKELHSAASEWQRKVSFVPCTVNSRPSSCTESRGNVPSNSDPGLIDNLFKDDILKKVAMPGEDRIRASVEAMETFTPKFDRLLTAEAHESIATQNHGTKTDSLKGLNGSFEIFQLTEDCHFQSMIGSMANLAALAERVHGITDEKTMFEWIRLVIDWVDRLRVACTPPASTNGSDHSMSDTVAKRLLTEAKNIFILFSEKTKHFLGRYGLFISKNEAGELVLEPVRNSLSFTLQVVSWFPCLQHALQKDLARAQNWRDRLATVSGELRIAYDGFTARGMSPFDPVCVMEYLRLRSIANELVLNLAQFAVLPNATDVSLCRSIQLNLTGYLLSHASRETLQAHAESTFLAPARILDSSTQLFNALILRLMLAGKGSTADVDDNANFRSNFRLLLDKALQNSLQIMDVDVSAGMANLCILKAMEIESSLHVMYPASDTYDPVFPQYRDQGRALKRALEDTDNLLLCVRVLQDDIEADALVGMTSDELAPQRLKEERAQAEALARQQASLTVEAASGPDQEMDFADNLHTHIDAENETVANALPVLLGNSARSSDERAVSAGLETAATIDVDALTDLPGTHSQSPQFSEGEISPSKQRNIASFGQLVKKASFQPPPPPPSLALSGNAVGSGNTPIPPPDQYVTAHDGSTRFQIEVASRSHRFSASLLVEHDPENFASGWMTPHLCEFARVPVGEFSKFIHAKLTSGRNQALILRIDVESASDQKEYMTFCELYEAKGRIAMFNLNEWAKMYLITPAFQNSAKKLVSFQKSSSPYAVVITRRTTDDVEG